MWRRARRKTKFAILRARVRGVLHEPAESRRERQNCFVCRRGKERATFTAVSSVRKPMWKARQKHKLEKLNPRWDYGLFVGAHLSDIVVEHARVPHQEHSCPSACHASRCSPGPCSEGHDTVRDVVLLGIRPPRRPSSRSRSRLSLPATPGLRPADVLSPAAVGVGIAASDIFRLAAANGDARSLAMSWQLALSTSQRRAARLIQWCFVTSASPASAASWRVLQSCFSCVFPVEQRLIPVEHISSRSLPNRGT